MRDEAFYENVYAIVMEIPKGTVASYQQIARLAGRAQNARLVGRALRHAELFGSSPCHRVVHSDGSLVQGWDAQHDLLVKEGITFLSNGLVNMKTCLWRI